MLTRDGARATSNEQLATTMMNALLKVQNLRTYFFSKRSGRFIRAVDDVSFEMRPGETFGLVGESGSGKSVTALSVMGLVRDEPGVLAGRVLYQENGKSVNLLEGLPNYVKLEQRDAEVTRLSKDNTNWLKAHDVKMKPLRGRKFSMIFQNPKSSMNPYFTIGDQIIESVMWGCRKKREEAKKQAVDWLRRVYIDLPERRMQEYSFNLSGGMCQRAMIAMALACRPKLLIADEPTTGLDATIQSVIVDLLLELKRELKVAILLITHNIEVIGRLSDYIGVMYAGRIMESGPSDTVLKGRRTARNHPYTIGLLQSLPGEDQVKRGARLKAIAGDVPDVTDLPVGCKFYPRCALKTPRVDKKCKTQEPPVFKVGKGHTCRCWLYTTK